MIKVYSKLAGHERDNEPVQQNGNRAIENSNWLTDRAISEENSWKWWHGVPSWEWKVKLLKWNERYTGRTRHPPTPTRCV